MSSNSESTSRQVSQSNLEEEISGRPQASSTPQVSVSERSSFNEPHRCNAMELNNQGSGSVDIESAVSVESAAATEINEVTTASVGASAHADVLEALERGESRRRSEAFKFFKSPFAAGMDTHERWLRIFLILGIFPLPILGWFLGLLYSVCIPRKTKGHRKLSGILGVAAAIATILGGAIGFLAYDYYYKKEAAPVEPGHPKFERATLDIKPSVFKDQDCEGFKMSSYIESSEKQGEKTVLFILDNAPEGFEKEKLFYVPQRFNYKIAVANVKNIEAASKLFSKPKTHGNAVATAVLGCLKLDGSTTTLFYGFNEEDAMDFQKIVSQKAWDAVFAASTSGPCETIPGQPGYSKEPKPVPTTWPTASVSLEKPGKELSELKNTPKPFATHVGLANEFVFKTDTLVSVPVPAHVTYGSYANVIKTRKGSYDSILAELFTLNKMEHKKLCPYKFSDMEHFTVFAERSENALASFMKYKEAMKGEITPIHRAAIEEYL